MSRPNSKEPAGSLSPVAKAPGFTPGPWHLDSRGDVLTGMGAAVAHVHTSGGNTANARLIAAAPELVKALRAFYDWNMGKPSMERQEVVLCAEAFDVLTKAGVL